MNDQHNTNSNLPAATTGPAPVTRELVEALIKIFKGFVVLSDAAAMAAALYVLHTWVLDAAETAPRLLIKSATKGSGKTTLLTTMSYLVPRPIAASNITAAALFRVVNQERPTLLIDEADTFVHSGQLNGILNSGHKRDTAYVIRLEKGIPVRFRTWGSMIIAGIGDRADTLEDRSIIIELRRRREDEAVTPFTSKSKPLLQAMAEQIEPWSQTSIDLLREAEPFDVPGLQDRAADNWQPLLAIAAMAGSNMLQQAKAAALTLFKQSQEDAENLIVVLLEDIRGAFGASDKISSDELVQKLGALEHRPWAEWKGTRPLTKHQLARLLRPIKIQPLTIRLSSEKTPKGYKLDQFQDAFSRFLGAEKAA